MSNKSYDDVCVVNVTRRLQCIEFVDLYMSYLALLLNSAENVSIRDVKDPQFLPEKVSSKVAKELFERFQEYEHTYQKDFAGKLVAIMSGCAYNFYLS